MWNGWDEVLFAWDRGGCEANIGWRFFLGEFPWGFVRGHAMDAMDAMDVMGVMDAMDAMDVMDAMDAMDVMEVIQIARQCGVFLHHMSCNGENPHIGATPG